MALIGICIFPYCSHQGCEAAADFYDYYIYISEN